MREPRHLRITDTEQLLLTTDTVSERGTLYSSLHISDPPPEHRPPPPPPAPLSTSTLAQHPKPGIEWASINIPLAPAKAPPLAAQAGRTSGVLEASSHPSGGMARDTGEGGGAGIMGPAAVEKDKALVDAALTAASRPYLTRVP